MSKIISGTFSYEKTGHPQPDLMREAQMVDHELCRLTGRRCYQSYYGGAPCSKTPTLNDARECLIALGEKNKELEGEIQQADRWIGRLSLQILANPASERIKN